MAKPTAGEPLTIEALTALLATRPPAVPDTMPIGVLDTDGHFRPVAFGGWRCVEDATGFTVLTLCLVLLAGED